MTEPPITPSPSLTPTGESAPPSRGTQTPPIPDPTPILPGPNTAPSKAEFLAALRANSSGVVPGSSTRPPPSSLHTSTFSVADREDEAGGGRGDRDDDVGSEVDSVDDRARMSPATPSGTSTGNPVSPGISRVKRHIYGLSVDGYGSPEGSTLALPYGTSRNNSVETFATFNSDDIKAARDGHDSDQSMLEDAR